MLVAQNARAGDDAASSAACPGSAPGSIPPRAGIGPGATQRWEGAHSRFPGHALTPTGVMAIRCKQFQLPDL